MERLKKLQDTLRKVLNDEEDPSEIDLEDKTATFSVLPNLSKGGLQAEHYRLSLISVAAKSLGLGTLELTASTALSYLNVLCKKFHNHSLEMLEVSKDDIAETALALLHELESNSILFRDDSIEDAQRVEDDSMEDAQRVEDDSMEDAQRVEDDSMEDAQRVEDDSMQDAQRFEDDSMQDAQRVEDDSMQDGQRIEDDSGQVGSNQADKDVSVAGPSGRANNEPQGNKQTRRNIPCDNNSGQAGSNKADEVVPVAGPSGTTTTSTQAKMKIRKAIPGEKKKNTNGEDKRKHNTPRSCPLCQKVVCNLPRHLRLVHVKNNEKIPPVRVKALAEMARQGNKVRGGKDKKTTKAGIKEYASRRSVPCVIRWFCTSTNTFSECTR